MRLLSIHVRHGCYLMQGHYICLGTKETLSEMLGMMDKSPSTRMKEHDERNRRKATGPGHPAPARTSGPSRKPGHPAPAQKSGAHHRRHPKLNHVSPDIRPEARTSGSSRAAGHPAPQPGHPTPPIQRLQKFALPAQTSGPQPVHPAPPEAPDIRPVVRTSGSVCLRTVKGRGPCTPSTP